MNQHWNTLMGSTYIMYHLKYFTEVTHLQYLVGCFCLVAVEESIVDHMTRPLPVERQLHHCCWWSGGPLCETLQRNILQQCVVTNSTEQVDLKDWNHLRSEWKLHCGILGLNTRIFFIHGVRTILALSHHISAVLINVIVESVKECTKVFRLTEKPDI